MITPALPAPYDQADVTLLGQGLTNRAYRLQLQGKRYFWRQGIAQPETLFIDRQQERQALSIAEAAGLHPQIHYHSADGQQLVLAWCNEPSWSPAYFSSSAGISLLGQLVARVHTLPARLKALDLADYLQRFINSLPSLPADLRRHVCCLQMMLKALPARPLVLCHNDINPANLLGTKPWLIDWEYAAMGDAAFELAVICRAGQFNDSQLRQLVVTYRSAGGDCDAARVMQMLPVVDMVSLLWCEKMLSLRPDARYETLRQELYLSVLGSPVSDSPA
ncbi:MAG: hypothetical protein EOM46_05865 [Gammaproteobacteria bacterium]|nr:hypothetical protein [Gammaproteobacteria bacterium]